MDSEPGDIIFSGNGGLTCHQFIRAVRERAIEAGHQRNDEWMADYASIRFEGEALKWFESLNDETQISWKLLRRSILSHYEEPAYEESLPTNSAKGQGSVFTFTGKDKNECQEFVREIRLRASAEERNDDLEWMIGLASPCFAGDALGWHASLPIDVQTNWRRLERAILIDYPFPPAATVFPARIRVEDWPTNVAPSPSIQSIRNREDWLQQATERRRMYEEVTDKSTPCWLLVQTERDIPSNALATGFERSGELLYSARVWYNDFGLVVGKCGKHLSGAALPLHRKEITGISPFEVLVGDPSYFRWAAVPYQGKNRSPIQHCSFFAVDAGVEMFRPHRAAFICQVEHEGGLHPGKAHSYSDWVQIGYDKKEAGYRTHVARVLAWAD
ncbi:hypothetical protein M407DRAFT_33745 [Tulasnella calospora MUT 4182]|uniref:Uncharacterized protein n=1 Tax=Tulasnella calospora MUT 4182 TaxID=1051891 RepID=A0A0C3PQ04_9AGAM|nr:hypothetical protein M407DRAFT_33745 [Tulasnella calospora MUT 4182]